MSQPSKESDGGRRDGTTVLGEVPEGSLLLEERT